MSDPTALRPWWLLVVLALLLLLAYVGGWR